MTDSVLVTVFKDTTLTVGAQLALDHRLYVSGWCLSHIYTAMRAGKTTYGDCIALVIVDNTPVASAAYQKTIGTVNTFCRKAYRRRGYATMAVTAVRDSLIPGSSMGAGEGAVGSRDFYAKMAVPIKL